MKTDPLHLRPLSALLAIIGVLCLLALTGCASSYKLPNVSGDSVVYSRTDPLGGTQIEATNVVVTPTEVRADTASWNTTYPSFSVKLTVKGYKRERTKEDKVP